MTKRATDESTDFVKTAANDDDDGQLIVNYNSRYSATLESITGFDLSGQCDDYFDMQDALSDIIRRRREEKGLSTRDVETVARSFVEIIDDLPEEAGEAARLLRQVASTLPQGSAAIARTVGLVKAKQLAAKETFDSPAPILPNRKARSVELDLEVQDVEQVRAAQRLLTEYSRHPERFSSADLDRIRAARRLRKGAERRRLASSKPIS